MKKGKWVNACLMTVISLMIFFCLPAYAGEVGVTDNSIKIGSVIDLTGPAAYYGKSQQLGTKIFMKGINDEGGINGRKLEYVFETNDMVPAKSIAAAKKLISQDKVFSFGVCSVTHTTVPLVPIMQKEKVPLIAPPAASTRLYIPPHRYVFPVYASYDGYGKLYVDFIVNNLKMKNAKIGVISEQTIMGKEVNKGLMSQLKMYGMNDPVDVIPYKAGAFDLSSHVNRLKAKNVDIVVLPGMLKSVVKICEEISKLGWKPIIIGSVSAADQKFIDMGGKHVEGVYVISTYYMLDSDRPAVVKFNRLAKKYYPDAKINTIMLTGYACSIILGEGIKRAGRNLTREGLVDAMETMKGYECGIIPPITFGPGIRNGSKSQAFFLQVKNGKFKDASAWMAPKE